jgi:uncharacterized protein YjbJ (UPF0337 family)
MNTNTYQGKWNQIKGEVQKTWGNLTNDDLEKAKGNAKVLVGTIQQKLGKGQDNVEEKVGEILKKYNVAQEDFSQNSKKPPARKKTDNNLREPLS